MNRQEFSSEFDVIYNNITSNQAPGLDEYEKSVFLTKALKQILLHYLNPVENKVGAGYDDTPKRLVDFSKLTYIENLYAVNTSFEAFTLEEKQKWLRTNQNLFTPVTNYGEGNNDNKVIFFDIALDLFPLEVLGDLTLNTEYENVAFTVILKTSNRAFVKAEIENCLKICIEATLLPWMKQDGVVTIGKTTTGKLTLKCDYFSQIPLIDDRGVIYRSPANKILCVLNERIICSKPAPSRLTVVPINYAEYSRLMNKPYKYPPKNLVWRLLHSDDLATYYEIISPYNKFITSYTIRYVKQPMPIILTDTLRAEGLSIEGKYGDEAFYADGECCECPEILHEPILQRAVELAKATYTGDVTTQLALGTASQTEIGNIPRQQ